MATKVVRLVLEEGLYQMLYTHAKKSRRTVPETLRTMIEELGTPTAFERRFCAKNRRDVMAMPPDFFCPICGGVTESAQ